jgi:hypothetical protein
VNDGAKQTEITDPDSATKSLAAMAAHAEVLDQKIKGIVGTISQHESGKPWGTAPEYGGAFQQNYHQGKGGAGAQFVKDNVSILAAETSQGVTAAHQALQGTVDLDGEIATMFTTKDSGSVGNQMQTTLKAWDDIHKDQQQGG